MFASFKAMEILILHILSEVTIGIIRHHIACNVHVLGSTYSDNEI